MAVVYYHPRYSAPSLRERVRPGGRIGLPLEAVRARLDKPGQQQLIPFLGAGASLPRAGASEVRAPQIRPSGETLDRICTEFELNSAGARRFVDIALQLA